MKYRILHDELSTDLQAAVQQALKEGWILAGGLAVAQSEVRYTRRDGASVEETNRLFAQAMIIP